MRKRLHFLPFRLVSALSAFSAVQAVPDRITVRVHPDRATVPVGGNVKLRAEVRGAKEQRVRWTLPGKGNYGRITDDGTYFAPASATTPTTITVRATSVAEPTAAATVTVNIPEVKLTLAPARARIQLGETVQLKTRVENTVNQDAAYAVEGKGRGSVSPAGVYTTSATMQTPTTVLVRATSAVDKSKQALCAIEVGAVETRIAPNRARINLGGTAQFRAEIRGAQDRDLVWSVLGGDVNGTVNESGLYRTPVPMTTPAKVTVRVASRADPSKFADAEVTVPAVELKVSPRPPGGSRNAGGVFGDVVHGVTRLYLPFDPVSPILFGPIFRSKKGTLYLPAGGSYQFYASAERTADQRVKWSLEGNPALGGISESGLYVAPTRLRTPATVSIRATSAADPTKSGLTSVTIPPLVIRAEPRGTTVIAGATAQLRAEVQNTVNRAVSWRVEGAQNGKVTDAGLYLAPTGVSTPRTVTVTAVSVADSTKEAPVTITIPEVKIELSRATLELKPGDTHKLAVKLVNAGNSSVKWTTDAPDAAEVDVGGLLRVASSVTAPLTIRVTATAVADPTKTAVCVAQVRPN